MSNEDKKSLRRVLMLGGLAVVLIGGLLMYLFSGRYASTDNAYIKSDIVMISPDVSGTIIKSPLHDNQTVKKGDVLFEIDPSSFDIALDMAEAHLVTAKADIEKLKAQYLQQHASVQSAQADLTYRQREYDRVAALRNSKAVSQSDVDTATKNLANARQNLTMLQQEEAGTLAQLDGNPDIPVEEHQQYKAALAARDKAALDLGHTVVRAPFDGTVGNVPHAGDYARAQAPSLSIVDSGHVWIDANFKETDLTRMREGQPVTIHVDTYPSHEWTGKVESISPATSSEFSILPAQNASGNWVKVVQRIPVRIDVNQNKNAPPLRAGMSTEVKVDTGGYPHLSAHAEDMP